LVYGSIYDKTISEPSLQDIILCVDGRFLDKRMFFLYYNCFI